MAGSDAAKVVGPSGDRYDEVLTPEALAFVADLQRTFGTRREQLLGLRQQRRQQAADTGKLGFLDETKSVRDDASWKVAPVADLTDRRGGETGPTRRTKAVNAPNTRAPGVLSALPGAQTPP